MEPRVRIIKIALFGASLSLMAMWLFPCSSASTVSSSETDSIVVGITILPDDVKLNRPQSQQRLLVEAVTADGRNEDLTRRTRFFTSIPQVAAVSDHGIVAAVSDGETNIAAEVDDRRVTARVRGADTSAPSGWTFRNHVLPVMTKMGCNSGACHGAAAGKNGFKLTLRGYDPELDYMVLTRQAAGRRINKLEPAKSLILLKPTLTIPHGGGKRFEVGSLEYQVIAQWIANGMQPPSETDPVIQRLEVLPERARLARGQEQQLLVRAHFSDGHSEDVTRWAKYSSTDDTVAAVTEDGRVKMQGDGEAAIAVWYLSKVSLARVSVPFPNKVDPRVYESAPRRNFIDELVLTKLKQLNLTPSGLCSDSEFIRRAYLDTAGILPTADEVAGFLADTTPNKRAKLIEALLERPEFIDYWAYKWSDLLLVSSKKLGAKNVRAYYKWIRESVAANRPWDRFVRELTTASGDSQEYGAVNYYLIHRNPIELAENYTKAFIGLSITCARCHNHPLEKWTQKDYYSFANLFARVSVKNGTAAGEFTVFSSEAGEINHPRLAKPLPPRPLDGEPIALESNDDRREYLAKWATSPDNPYFARCVVNRVWGNFFGRGLVHPVDDLRATNPASNEELLAALSRDFVAHGFDVKHLIRTILSSSTYQLSSQTNETNAKDEKYYSHYIVRRLPAEVILDAISQVTAVPEKFPGYPPGTRAMQLPDTRVDSYFLTVFGRPERTITSVAERQQDPSLTQALHIINGGTVNRKLTARGGTIDLLLKPEMTNQKIVEHLYLAAYSRYPSAHELNRLLEALAKERGGAGESGDSRRLVLEDLAWAIFTSKEFLFNH